MADIDQLIELLGARVAAEQQEAPYEPPQVESQEVIQRVEVESEEQETQTEITEVLHKFT